MPPPIDPTTARLEPELKHASPLIGCRFDPSGRFLFASAQDATIHRFDLLTGSKVALAGHPSWVRGMAFITEGSPSPGELLRWEQRRDAVPAAAGPGGGTFAPPTPQSV